MMAVKKLTKNERLQVAHAIEDTLDGYCRAGCPNSNLNTPSAVCKTCPASVLLKQYGVQLGFERSSPIEKSEQKDWTEVEEKYLIEAYEYSYSYARMAADLERTISSVNMRLRKLRKEERIIIRVDRK